LITEGELLLLIMKEIELMIQKFKELNQAWRLLMRGTLQALLIDTQVNDQFHVLIVEDRSQLNV